jgi:CSLREA domain-containing protein
LTGRLIAASAAALFVLVPAASAATITVTTTTDTVANDGACALREALTAAATDTASGAASGECAAGVGADTVALASGSYVLSRAGVGDDANVTGDLDVTAGTVTITGVGPTATTIDAGGIDRVLDVLTGATVTLQNLKITGGKLPTGVPGAPAGNGGTGVGGGNGTDSTAGQGAAGAGGGGVRSAGALNLDNVIVTGNRAGDGGLGGNSSTGGAGGTAANASGGNGGASRGGAGGDGGDGGGLLGTAGAVTITDSTFTGNVAGTGGIAGGAAAGGTGGAGQGNGQGGIGGGCFGGSGGTGGSGGAIDAEAGTLVIDHTDIEQNLTGAGGNGGPCAHGGTGGAGAGSGNGGTGGFDFPGSGGEGGEGGGVAAHGTALTLTRSTIASNTAANGGTPSNTGVGGDGGTGGSGTGSGGAGGFVDGGSGGSGGSGGGVIARSTNAGTATATLVGDTITGNQSGSGATGGDVSSGGAGGGDGGGGGSSGSGGDSSGGFGGEAGFGGGADFDALFTASDLTVTANHGGSGAAGGAGGSGPGRSHGGFGGEAAFGGGIIGSEGSLAHITMVANSVASGGAGGSAGTGTPNTAGNSEGPGAGADLEARTFGSPTITLSASIVGVCDGTLDDGGGNVALASTTPCPGTVADPALGPLADNGGPTRTMALAAGSPAVDHIAVPCGTSPDQRGVARPQGLGCDAGAYELAPPGVTTSAASGLAETSATVAGQITPNARATTWHVEFGRTTAYGSRTPDQPLAAGLAPVAVTVALTALPARTVTHYRLVATNADGTTNGADATFTTSTFPGVTIVKRTLRSSARGRVPVIVACPSGVSGSCTGTLSMAAKIPRGKKKPKAKTVTLAHSGFTISPGSRKTIRLRLSSHGRALLRAAGRGGEAVTLSAVAKDASGISARTTVPTRLKP